MSIREKTIQLIDALKATCKTYGMGNDGNEYKIITQVFLYKYLNDKFGYEVKNAKSDIARRIASADKWELAYAQLSDDERQLLSFAISPDVPMLEPYHLIYNLWNQQAKGDFDTIFDATMTDIAEKMPIFSLPKPLPTPKFLYSNRSLSLLPTLPNAPLLLVLWSINLSISRSRRRSPKTTTSSLAYSNISSRTTTPLAVANMPNTTPLTLLQPSWLAFSWATMPICIASSATTPLPVLALSSWL